MAMGEKMLQMGQADGTDKLHLCSTMRTTPLATPFDTCITHPSERKINLRIQTKGGLLAVDMFQKGLEHIMGVCQHILSKFEASMEEYNAQEDVAMEEAY
uniref:DNA-directed RNA polymerase RBP11-like dimerisation domain-containing protein n=1 Tax=Podarcis muralis TaxID=64176 RepID=A0A670J0V3_PODMU